MSKALLQGTYHGRITINDVRSHSIIKTLADEDVRYGGAILVDIAIERLAHTMDRNPRDFEVHYHDSEMVRGDYAWDVEVGWWIGCELCEYVAEDQSRFSSDLCPIHLTESLQQELADQDNDDRAIGMMP